MKKQEKLFFLLDKINEARKITPSNKPIRLHPTDLSLANQVDYEEMQYILEKLEKDEKVVKVIENPIFSMLKKEQ